ncbi:MAG TPA: alpha/beta fold hydrolase [Candidatus Angelobacter sp.]|nr:alpha/beta fold hydrolase [Candidatus Angelobacter sp.]
MRYVPRPRASIAILFLPAMLWPQTHATGVWKGSQCSGDKCQAIVLRVDGDSKKATVDLPDFGALDIPASRFALDAGRVHFELVGDETTVVFEGTVAAQSIRGNWKEPNRSGEFHLARAPDTQAQVRKEDVSFQNGGVRLAGTLLLPATKSRTPAIVFVQGAGPETRSASRFLAEYFASRGMAALIYDKRGAGASTGDWQHSSFEDLAGDTDAALDYLKKRPEVDPARVGMFGSSQGGWIAPLAATRTSRVCFVVVKSAAGVTPEEQELVQVEINMRRNGDSEERIQTALALYRQMIAYSRTRQNWDALSSAMKAASDKYQLSFGNDIEQDWWFFDFIQLTFSYDPVPVLEQVQSPLLIVFGGKDRFLPLDRSVARLSTALGTSRSAVIQVFPNAGHDLRVEPAKDSAWDFPRFAPGYLETVASWVQLQTQTCQ